MLEENSHVAWVNREALRRGGLLGSVSPSVPAATRGGGVVMKNQYGEPNGEQRPMFWKGIHYVFHLEITRLSCLDFVQKLGMSMLVYGLFLILERAFFSLLFFQIGF